MKIDGGFLRRATGCERDRVILHHMVGLAKALATAVVGMILAASTVAVGAP